jgi:hypothetical protein
MGTRGDTEMGETWQFAEASRIVAEALASFAAEDETKVGT